MLNPKQRMTIILGVGAGVAMLLFPPMVIYDPISLGDPSFVEKRRISYSPTMIPRGNPMLQKPAHVHRGLFGTQLVVLVMGAGALMYGFRHKMPHSEDDS